MTVMLPLLKLRKSSDFCSKVYAKLIKLSAKVLVRRYALHDKKNPLQ